MIISTLLPPHHPSLKVCHMTGVCATGSFLESCNWYTCKRLTLELVDQHKWFSKSDNDGHSIRDASLWTL